MRKKLIIWCAFATFVLLLFIVPHQNIKITDIMNTFQGCSPEHWLGTDNLGRDLLALMITGGQRTMIVVFLSSIISFTGGSLLGMIAAYEGGLCRTIIQFIADFVTVIPSLIMALIFSALFGFSAPMAGIIFGIGNMGQYINLSEGLTTVMKEKDFVINYAAIDSDMNIYVGNIKKFTALPGASDDSYAVRVTSVIREEE